MALVLDDLRCIAHGAGSQKIFAYTTNDLITAVDDSGYFNAATNYLSLGDIILVSGDLDGTPANVQLSVTSATGAATVTTIAAASITYTFNQKYYLQARISVLGTAETVYVVAPAAGSISKVKGVSNVNGAGSGGTSTITVSVPTTGAVATLAFAQDYTAGTMVEDTTITAHTLLADAVITVTTDGTGSHTGVANVTLEITPS